MLRSKLLTCSFAFTAMLAAAPPVLSDPVRDTVEQSLQMRDDTMRNWEYELGDYGGQQSITTAVTEQALTGATGESSDDTLPSRVAGVAARPSGAADKPSIVATPAAMPVR
jgi:hypothetical protein